MATELQGSAREDVLGRIRKAIGGGGSQSAVIREEWQAIPREYKRVGELEHDAVLEQLEDRLRDYDANVVRAETSELAETIARPQGLEAALGITLPAGFEFVTDDGLSALELDAFQGVVTASAVAISETGTIVLQNVPGQGRRAPTLVPDYHLCLVRSGDVVETVPEAMARLAATSSLATTFVSGPSATADIEMTRIKGVHGPRFLDVILIP
jgi:L-lactate dehydrogenase complex protein LldG